jgi:hypothetical protein
MKVYIKRLKKERNTYKARYEYMLEFNKSMVKRKQKTDKLNRSLINQLRALKAENDELKQNQCRECNMGSP